MSLSQEQIQKYTDCLQSYVNSTVKELRRLFLVQDLVDSLKVGDPQNKNGDLEKGELQIHDGRVTVHSLSAHIDSFKVFKG